MRGSSQAERQYGHGGLPTSAARRRLTRWLTHAGRGVGAVPTAPAPDMDPMGWPVLALAWMQRRPISPVEYQAIDRALGPAPSAGAASQGETRPQAHRRPGRRNIISALVIVLVVLGVTGAALSADLGESSQRPDAPACCTARSSSPDALLRCGCPRPTVPWLGDPALMRAGRI